MTAPGPPPGWYQRGTSPEPVWWDGTTWIDGHTPAKSPPSLAAPAGWYPSGVPGEYRWWDGQQWTDHRSANKAQPAQFVSTANTVTNEPRIKWAGVNWGSAPPVAMLVCGLLILALASFWFVLTLLWDSLEWWRTLGVMAMLFVFALMGVAVLVEAHFGFKLRKLRSKVPPVG